METKLDDLSDLFKDFIEERKQKVTVDLIKILNANERSTATWGEDISEDTIFEIISGYGEFSKRD